MHALHKVWWRYYRAKSNGVKHVATVLLYSMAPLVPLVVDEHLNTPTAGFGVTLADAFWTKKRSKLSTVWFASVWFGFID